MVTATTCLEASTESLVACSKMFGSSNNILFVVPNVVIKGVLREVLKCFSNISIRILLI